ncbi:bifunctional 5,10-methylenetetrahydrofolate dehydrogenase/5,10-methenyltetrahydrofolate cyclohydrolase [Candidatus Saccharibacteria bacterium]|nr:bifunctional 5,10-methylenetetrahydrofolate dehydrogenase/5,10-methenyltetrahydrofolate cyclohydrolase [Candidatus Saccharibacteria bacterium]
MTKIIDGRKIAQKVYKDLKPRVEKLAKAGVQPKLVIIGVNPDEPSKVYIRMKQRRAGELDIATEYLDLSSQSPAECEKIVAGLAEDLKVHGIIAQLPFNGWGSAQELLDHIPAEKDVDGLSSTSQELLKTDKAPLVPATPKSILELLRREDIELKGKHIVIVGRGQLVGKPLHDILASESQDVTVAHRQTEDFSGTLQKADVIISAAGKAGLVTGDMVKKGAVVIDAGTMDVGGELKGDVDFSSVKEKASYISPVPGGVGPVTVAMLLENVVEAAENLSSPQ